jgi:hypothetical protein
MVIDGLDIFYPPYPSQLVVDVYQNVKHVFGVCIFCPHRLRKGMLSETKRAHQLKGNAFLLI